MTNNVAATALPIAVTKTVETSNDWLASLTTLVDKADNFIWGLPLIITILFTGILLTCMLRFLHLLNLRNAFRYMFHTEEGTRGGGLLHLSGEKNR